MKNRKLIYFFILFILILSLILGFMIHISNSQTFKVVFLNVGQGDAILISQGINQILIDSGSSGQVISEKIGKYIPFWDRKIETIVMTHPDQDHIGGFVEIFKNYEVKTVIKTNAQSESKTYNAISELIYEEGSEVVEAKIGINIIFPNGIRINTIYPFDSVTESKSDTNSSSVVMLLDHKKSRFLFTGDIPMEKENEILQKGIDISADILKVSHHGSKYSTSDEFLKAISPKDTIISVGKNSYGHPTEDVLQRLKKIGARIFRTDEVGDIEYFCKSAEQECVLQN